MDKPSKARSSEEIADWRDASFHMVIYEYFVKNMSLPSDMGTLIGYILFFIITWYVLLWALRFMFSMIWPVVMVVLAVLMIRFLATFEASDLIDMFFQAVVMVSDMLLSVGARVLEFGLSFLN
ncbi:uncharacterized protein DMAD_03251 [Drosophila madeirensis]|uniref:Uncharacterized protein n=1 Tax=Drosophila madeirensis TaxID=30013 RepID=A0AAU9G9B9_DROMD